MFYLIQASIVQQESVKCEDMGSQTEPFNSVASLDYQVLPNTEISKKIGETTKDSDNIEYPLVGGSNSSVHGVEPIVKEKAQNNKNFLEELADIIEAKMNAAIAAQESTLPNVTVDSTYQEKPWALPASGLLSLVQCPECPSPVRHDQLKGHFLKCHKDSVNVIRVCKGIPECYQNVSLWNIDKHFEQHIHQIKSLVEIRRTLDTYKKLRLQHPFLSPPFPHIAPSPPFLGPQGPWVSSPWHRGQGHLQAPRQQGTLYPQQGWRW